MTYIPYTVDKIVHKLDSDGCWTMVLYRKNKVIGRYYRESGNEHEQFCGLPNCLSDLEDNWIEEKDDNLRPMPLTSFACPLYSKGKKYFNDKKEKI